MSSIRPSVPFVVALAVLLPGTRPASAADAPAPAPQAPPAAGPAPAPAPAPQAPPAAPPRTQFPDPDRIERSDGKTLYFYRTNFVKPQELVATVKNLLQLPGVEMKDFPRANQVVIEGTPEAIETALDAFAYFDVPENQVYVEAKIVEVTYDNNFEFGFSSLMDRDLAGPNTFFRGESITLNPPSFLQSQLPGNLPFQGLGLAFGTVGKAAEKYGLFDLSLQALQRNGNAEILSRPSIVATENVRAEVKTEQQIPVVSLDTTTSVAPIPGVPVNNFGNYANTLVLRTTYQKTKVGLEVMPLFIGDGFVKLEVVPTVSTVTGFAVGQGGTTSPILSDRNAKTTVTLADGDTLVIGGLYTDATLKDTAKVPFLGDIPGVGKLFTRVRDTKVKTELMFLITPHILRKRTDYKIIAPPAEKERLGETCPPPAGAPGPAGAR